MEKYRVTDKHQLLKEDIVLEFADPHYISSVWAHPFTLDEIEDWINSGWLEEIQEPEFTRDDMMLFAKWCEKCVYSHLMDKGTDSFAIDLNLDKWIKEHKKE